MESDASTLVFCFINEADFASIICLYLLKGREYNLKHLPGHNITQNINIIDGFSYVNNF